ncbi:MAG: ABC transporter transmembrane domain-containing protein, partial [Roseiarcus sp.]
MFRFFETRIDPFREHDESTPPASLFGYYGRYCRQVWPFLVALMAIGLVVSLIEVSILRFVGALVDTLRPASPDRLLREHGGEFLAMGLLILIGRPLANFTHDLLTQQAIAPGMTNLIRWQTHRYVLRQSLTYFANDFAGRIASNIIQAAASLRDSVVQVIDALWFVAVFAISALVIFAETDWRLACPLALWIAGYLATLAYFIPRIRRRSQELAHMRATLTGRIVDSYANIQTVKLFAHLEREDRHAREALFDHTAAFHRQTRMITLMNLTVSTSNSFQLVSVGGVAVWLWSLGVVTLGDVALAAGLAHRVVAMSGFVMWTSIGIFDNVG